jgi:preprotein translocase subunit SecB
MATMSGDGANGGAGVSPMPEGTAPMFTVLVQYSKDFSFQINVNPRQMSATDYEVELKLEGKAEHGGNTMFAFDLNYAGVFRLVNIPQENLGPLLMIECPRLLFPFAREIISNAIANGGFPPLLLNPVDFVGLYQQRMAEMQAVQEPVAQA